MSEHGPAKNPCGSCPYRKDVPSGVWHENEYKKLPEYDKETPYQPPGAFFCHQQNGRLCAGWVGCHDMQESLGLRFAGIFGLLSEDDLDAALDYESPVELFESGQAAADHGRAQIEAPDSKAQKTIDKLVRKRERRERETA